MMYRFDGSTGLSGAAKVVVSPNPASSTLVVSTAPTSGAAKKQAASDGWDIREVRLSDKMGNLLRKQLFPAGTSRATINVEGLKPDVYILQTGNGKTFDTQQVIIAR
ncbi:T9SS type A sorting domain-containing protein [Chitinophaga sp. CF118]|uniref:T9SS type A sorting domain-containing protein n=1 Tax=Chitinophaga sp. CF118 TaxID=1884367 RepID=UPI00116062CD|nr:T9SS type A sorting domain-containing protein [Chitinophaga sp. CF118]